MYTRKQVAEARKIARNEFGVRYLLSFDSDPKTAKSNKKRDTYRFLTVIMYLAPANLGGHEVCASRSVGCTMSCLHTAGNPIMMAGKEKARLNRKRLYFERRDIFEILLWAEIDKYRRLASAENCKLAIRLNGTSDIVWERVMPWLFTEFSDCQFYDYTKHVKRVRSDWQLPSNYDLTFSRSESNHADCLDILRTNPNARVSVVFSPWRTKPIPTKFESHPVDDADTHDLTFTRPAGWLGLRAKGEARKDKTGFVVQVN